MRLTPGVIAFISLFTGAIPSPLTAVSSLRRVKWSAEWDLDDIVSRKEPVLLEDSNLWKQCGLSTWTPEVISEHIPTLFGVKELNRTAEERTYFNYFAREAAFLQLEGFEPKGPDFSIVNISSPQFFSEAESRHEVVRYFTFNLLAFKSLIEDHLESIECFKPFAVPEVRPAQTVNLWLGTAGGVARMHYDCHHNFFLQVHGTKRFLLLPPSAGGFLGTFPTLHPFNRQAIKFLWENGELDIDAVRTLGGFVVTLYPGDMMYLPPYWFHEVEALDLSISVNMWSMSSAFDVRERLRNLPVPFEDDWSEDELTFAFVSMVRSLSFFVHKSDSPLLHLKNRYQASLSLGRLTCEEKNDIGDMLTAQRKSEIEERVETGVAQFVDIVEKLPREIRGMEIANYFETVGEYFFGKENVASIFQRVVAGLSREKNEQMDKHNEQMI